MEEVEVGEGGEEEHLALGLGGELEESLGDEVGEGVAGPRLQGGQALGGRMEDKERRIETKT